jgi:hypothetical protein
MRPAEETMSTARRIFSAPPGEPVLEQLAGRWVVARVLPSGLTVRLFADDDEGPAVTLGEYKRESLQFIRRTLSEGDFAVDVGAGRAVASLAMAWAVGESGAVCAFESDPLRATLIDRAFEENGFADTARTGVFRIGDGDPGRALDSLGLQGQIHLIRFNVGGDTLRAIAGADALIRERKPAVLVEMEPGRMWVGGASTVAEVVARIESRGYHAWSLQSGRLHARIRSVSEPGPVAFLPR